MDEEIDYRSPVGIGEAEPVSTRDEADYSTLIEVKKDLDQAVVGLYKDFNAFDLINQAAPKLEIQTLGRQIAHEILVPLQAKIDLAVEGIKRKQGS